MQNGGKADSVLLREHAPIPGGKVIAEFYIYIFLLNLLKDQLWFQFNFLFFTINLHGYFFKFVPDGFNHTMIDYPLSCELCG